MTAKHNSSPRRLVYGTAPYALRDGVVMDAESAARWGKASHAQTWGEFVRLMYNQGWDDFGADDDVTPEDPFDFEEWLNETWDVGPQEVAHDIAAVRIRQLQTERPDLVGAILLGGASPGGNINTIDGPLHQVQALAALIDPARDGFWLERDDALIDAGLARHLYERGPA